MKENIDNISKYLLENNIKPSFQRIKILEYILVNKNHPTVDDIYSKLIKEIPTLSKTTVYNTLNIFLNSNIVRYIYTEDNELRYDYMEENHGHFKCNSCGEIYDFKIDIDYFKIPELKKFKTIEKNVYYKGVCPKCLGN
ncbi:MAG: Fur family transcriptional regulator [Clostridiales bacterium]